MRWLVCVMVLVGTAAAETRSPFVIVDQIDGVTRAGVDLTSLSTRTDVRFLVVDVHGHVIEPRTQIGGYLRVQWLHWSDHRFYADPYERGPSYSARNSTTAGISWSRSLSARLALITHLDVTPSSSSASDGRPIRHDSMLLRPSRFYSSLPGASSMSVGGSLMLREGRTVARLDAGAHVIVDRENFSDSTDRIGGGTHLNAAAGVKVHEDFTLGVELSTLWIDLVARVHPAPLGFDRTDVAVLAVLGVSGRYQVGHVQIYAAGAIPLRKYPAEAVSGGITLGVEGSL